MHACMHAHIHACMHAYINVHACVHACMHTYTYILVHTCTYASGILDAIEGSLDADSDSIPNYLDLDRWGIDPKS